MPSRFRRTAVLLAFTLLLAACGGSASPTEPVACAEPSDGVLTLTADNLAFHTSCLRLPAGEPITIHLVNAEDVEPHNVAIYTDSTKASQLFVGDFVDGGETVDYPVPALEPGAYFFECNIHPAMKGSVIVE